MNVNRCIVCWLDFLNKRRGNKGIVDPNLMKLCPNCRRVTKPSRFTMYDALHDPKNKVHCGTATLKPALHKYPPHIVWDVYKKIVQRGFQNRKKANYFEGYAEFTPSNNCLHLHFYAAGSAHSLGDIYAGFRRLGFLKIKQCFDSEAWLKYCRKEFDPDDELKPIICIS